MAATHNRAASFANFLYLDAEPVATSLIFGKLSISVEWWKLGRDKFVAVIAWIWKKAPAQAWSIPLGVVGGIRRCR
jgi:hypothetical protein